MPKDKGKTLGILKEVKRRKSWSRILRVINVVANNLILF